jgi:alpha-glucosidase (family GH31 glycosyl hydrolase)
MRFHSGHPVEPWEYGEQAESAVRDWIDLRYRLLPYLYAQAHQASAAGLPMMSPLVLRHQEDPNVRTMGDQFYLGTDLLVAPLLEPGNRRRVYLPAGMWYELLTSHRHESCGEWIEWQGSVRDYPVFVRAGSIIPLGPRRRHTGESPRGPITLLYYPGPAGETTFMEPGECVGIRHTPTADGVDIEVEARRVQRPWMLMKIGDTEAAVPDKSLGELLPTFPAIPIPGMDTYHTRCDLI